MASPFLVSSKKPGGKKIVIKPFKDSPKLPESFEEETWNKLKAAIEAVQQRKGVRFSEEELYNAVQSLCIHKFSATLYENLRLSCASHIKTAMDALTGIECDSVTFLEHIGCLWDRHCEQMHTIKLIFAYLDRTYVFTTSSLRSIWNMGLELFCKYFSENSEVRDKTIDGLLLLVQRERDGQKVARSLIHKLVAMLMALQVYKEMFESIFLEQSKSYYSKEAGEMLYTVPVGQYLQHVDRRISEENDRVIQYLDPGTRRPLIGVVEQYFLRDHSPVILERGFHQMMEETQVQDLTRLYRLFTLIGAQDAVKTHFKEYIRKTGLGIVMDDEKDSVMLNELLNFKAKLDSIWEKAFQKNEQFGYTLKDAFENFINQRQNKPAELIAKYLDSKLRSGPKGESEDELDDVIDRVMVIFRFVNSKDVFEAFYKKDLAKRLLLGRSASFDAEKSIISKLKAECGTQLSGKLEGMFKDIELSHDIVAAFRQSKESRDPRMGDVELNVFVLTTGYWPTYPPCDVKLPKELSEHQDVFKSFYLSRYQGRRLLWQSSLAQCTIRAQFPSGRKELSVSLFQTLVLLLFNDADELGHSFIKENTNIEDGELERTLQSLALGQVRVLRRKKRRVAASSSTTEATGTDAAAHISKDDAFVFNNEFSHRMTRIKINQIQLKETPEEQRECTEKVFVDRQYQIDAAIVRVMKARKTLSHSALLQELFTILKFPAVAADLKKRMESLIEREYMSRDEENPGLYHYVA